MVKIDDLKAGDKLVADGSFICLMEGDVVAVVLDTEEATKMKDKALGLWVPCADGRHYLIGQVDDAAGVVVGFKREE